MSIEFGKLYLKYKSNRDFKIDQTKNVISRFISHRNATHGVDNDEVCDET
jgi:hypothetical protein